jgi:hypothetical protein
VTLWWIDMADNEDGFRLYRNLKLVATLGPNANTYTYTATAPIGASTFVLVAYSSGGNSNPATVSDSACP